MRIEPLGDSALIVRVVDDFGRDPEGALNAVLAGLRALETAEIPGVVELAPAYTTVGVFFDPTRIESFDGLRATIERIVNASSVEAETKIETPLIEIPVCYDSEFALDLDDVARVAGVDGAEVIRRHSSAAYRVELCGIHCRLSVHERIAAGTRDAAPGRSAQGGSRGLGRDRRRANGNLSTNFAGRLESDRAHSAPLVRCSTRSSHGPASGRSGPFPGNFAGGIRRLFPMKVFVRSAGFLASVQDLGRTGHRQSGISIGGALDSHALRVANALVGNEDSAAGLEATLGTLRLRFEDQRVVAWCGGAFSVRIGAENLPPGHAALVAKGEELAMAAPKSGARAWLAISGGIDVPPVLGSRSTDLRGNFGGHEGRALRDGDELPLGTTKTSRSGGLQTAEQRNPAIWKSPLLGFLNGARPLSGRRRHTAIAVCGS